MSYTRRERSGSRNEAGFWHSSVEPAIVQTDSITRVHRRSRIETPIRRPPTRVYTVGAAQGKTS
ncbi:hypothetical protein DLM45_02165 [Hyphomicrobium methylovorum]|nr:hypothetical protein [Hyphomicrobium methylovorum]